MKFVDTMASFKYLGGTIPTHVLMIIYGLQTLKNEERDKLVWVNPPCTNEQPKLCMDDVMIMIGVHSVCVFIISF